MARPSGSEVLRRVSDTCWRLLVIGAAIAVAVWLLRQVWPLVLAVVGAGLIAIALTPVVDWLHRRSLPRLAATVLVYLATLSLVAALVTVSAASVSSDITRLGDSLNESVSQVKDWATGPPLNLEPATFDRSVDGVRDQVNQLTSDEQLLSAARMAVSVVTGVLLALVLLFFFLKDGPTMSAWFVGLFPPDRRDATRRVARRARRALEGYLKGTVLIGLIEGVSVGVLMAVLGVSQFLPLAALTVVAAFFPIVGAVAAGVVAVLVTLVEAGPGRAIIAAAAIVVLQQVDGDLLQPLVMGQSVRLHPVAILLALTTGGLVAGIAGAFLAVPLTAAIAAAANELRHLREEDALQLPASGTSPPGRVP